MKAMQKKFIFLIFTLLFLFYPLSCYVIADFISAPIKIGEDKEKLTGFPCANFGVGVELSPSGRLLKNVIYNPPLLGRWLEFTGEGYFSFKINNVEIEDVDFQEKKISRFWPFTTAEFKDKRMDKLVIKANFFSPLKMDNLLISSLPVVMAEFELINLDKNKGLELFIIAHLKDISNKDLNTFIGFEGGVKEVSKMGSDLAGLTPLTKKAEIGKDSTKKLRFILVNFHKDGYYTNLYPTPDSLISFIFNSWDKLKKATSDFSNRLPSTNDQELDEYLRWYITAGVMLTKVVKSGEVLTMGYTELNQRDSFWTSYLHLVYWIELEKKMIKESAEYQRENGKIPTTILPVIERENDIDITQYFILRIFRYYEWTKDIEFLKEMWGKVKCGIEYLKGLDIDSDGLPDQHSFWADWKDVSGMEGRKYSPYFTLLWLAVLKKATYYAHLVEDKTYEEEYSLLYKRAYSKINKDIEEGGLWAGNYYVNIWYDKKEDRRLLQDQVVGILFDVVDKKRADKIFKSLENNKCRWGIRETYPYYPNSFGYKAGEYHNGAVWPYLNFIDAFSRFKRGYIEDGISILKTAAKADLIKDGDYLPHENINSETGENTHHFIQAWNAVYFAAVYFGLLNETTNEHE